MGVGVGAGIIGGAGVTVTVGLGAGLACLVVCGVVLAGAGAGAGGAGTGRPAAGAAGAAGAGTWRAGAGWLWLRLAGAVVTVNGDTTTGAPPRAAVAVAYDTVDGAVLEVARAGTASAPVSARAPVPISARLGDLHARSTEDRSGRTGRSGAGY